MYCLQFQMSPPANLSLLSQRMNSQQTGQSAATNTMSMVGRENPAAVVTAAPLTQQQQQFQQQQAVLPSQHKRSLSFNHHLSYNQYNTHTQHQQPHQMHHQQQPPSLPNHPVAVQNHKSNLVPISNSISKIMGPALPAQNMATNARTGSTKGMFFCYNIK